MSENIDVQKFTIIFIFAFSSCFAPIHYHIESLTISNKKIPTNKVNISYTFSSVQYARTAIKVLYFKGWKSFNQLQFFIIAYDHPEGLYIYNRERVMLRHVPT